LFSFLLCCDQLFTSSASTGVERSIHQLQSVRILPIILVTQEAEIRRITVQGKPKEIVPKTLP
jgi:hypothetical protein